MADSLAKAETASLEANERDVARTEANGTSAALIDQLRLTPDRIARLAEGLRELAALPDPVGDVVRGWTNANGLQVRQMRVPLVSWASFTKRAQCTLTRQCGCGDLQAMSDP
jgi:glutamate-5-semialdehyde dehydrogenase